MSLQSDCDIDPLDIDGLKISQYARPNDIMEGEETIVRKVDETTCLVAYVVQDTVAECPQDSWDVMGRAVLLDMASSEERKSVREALGAESVADGEIRALPWDQAREEFEEGALDTIQRQLATRFVEKYPSVLEDEWFNGVAPQRIIPEDRFIQAAADDAETRKWLVNRFGPASAPIHKLARRAWAECPLIEIPVTRELLKQARDLDRLHVEAQPLKRFATYIIKERIQPEEDLDGFIDELWQDLYEAEKPLRDPDLVELDYRTNGDADPIDLSVKDGFSDEPRAFVLFNEEGRKELDERQGLEAFSCIEEHGEAIRVRVYPEFRAALGLDDAPLEFKHMGDAQAWRRNVLEGGYFSLTPDGLEQGRAQARRAIAESIADLYEGWANGDVYGCVIERCDYDPDAGEWVYTDRADSLWEIYGESDLEMHLREILKDQVQQIHQEKVQTVPQAA